VHYQAALAPGACDSVVLKVPFITLCIPEELDQLRAKDFEQEHLEVRQYWKKRIATGAQIHTGEQDIDDFYRAHVTHVLINDDYEVGSPRIVGRVSSFNYGNFSNEAIMQIMDLDRRGYTEEARRHLDTYLHYQGTVGLPGNFQTQEGVFYGSGGYECGDYNQHHGWVLWGLAEHYRYTGDRGWLERIADHLIAGCDWVIRERQATMNTDVDGQRVPEYGFMPAGSLEDVRDFYYWLTTNVLTYRGLTVAAQALEEIGHPQGRRLLQDAQDFGEDLRTGFHQAMIRSPLVRLRDGTYIPYYPSRLYWRGRDFGWIREVLEGAIYLTTTVLEPTSQESTWILQDFEDNRYLDAPYNYPLDNFEQQWFDRGGFSMQPNLVYGLPPYLLRDQIEHFLRAFFNGFAACWRTDIRSMTEHPLPTLADWAGDHFKSSDEAMVAFWLRLMFIHEDGQVLHLGRGIPRYWLAPGKKVYIHNAQTHFGPMSLNLSTSEDGGQMVAQLDPPQRKTPDRIVLKFRHPNKAPLKQVTLDGQICQEIDVDKEWVVLPALDKPAEIVAHYEV